MAIDRFGLLFLIIILHRYSRFSAHQNQHYHLRYNSSKRHFRIARHF